VSWRRAVRAVRECPHILTPANKFAWAPNA
jgi:hypothetical protein